MRIGIITDIHENTGLLVGSLRIASERKCDEIVCIGDIAGYDHRFYNYDSARSAKECLRLIRANCKYITTGNHDLFAAGRFPEYSNGFAYPVDWFTLDPARRKSLAMGKVWSYEGESSNDLNEDDMEFLKKLPEFIIADFKGTKCLFSHYFAPDYTGSTTLYVERKAQLKNHWKLLMENNVSLSFCGHTHNSFTGFSYRSAGFFAKAIQSFPGSKFNLGDEVSAVILPPLSGEKGRCSFAVFDTSCNRLEILTLL